MTWHSWLITTSTSRVTSFKPYQALQTMSFPVLRTALRRAGVRRIAAKGSREVSLRPLRPLTETQYRPLSTTPPRCDVPSWPSPPVPQPPIGPSDDLTSGKESSQSKNWKQKTEESFWHAWSTSASFQAALTTVVGLGMVFGAGIGYLEWYKYHVLHRVHHPVLPS